MKICFVSLLLFLASICMSAPASENPMQVGFLILNKVYNSELMAPYDVFHHTVFHTKPGMRVFTISLNPGPITTFEGLKLQPDYNIANAPSINILVIPSAEHNMDSDLKDDRLRDWVRRKSEEAQYVVTLCDGAFILANTGMLNSKKATTFPSDLDTFRKLFPKVDTQENYSFVHDGKYLTSQGGAKSYDVAMYLVDFIYGEKVAAGVGKGLIIPWKNPSLTYLKVP